MTAALFTPATLATIEFTIPGEPVAKGRARSFARVVNGKAFTRHYTPDKTRQAEATLAARALPFRPPEPTRSPLNLTVVFVFPIPESWPRWRREAALRGEHQHVTKPDCDNLVKLLKDALNGVFWIDDKQICNVHASKGYGLIPETRIRIVELAHMEKKSA